MAAAQLPVQSHGMQSGAIHLLNHCCSIATPHACIRRLYLRCMRASRIIGNKLMWLQPDVKSRSWGAPFYQAQNTYPVAHA